jgi:DNA polymerase-3 subunit gamma/tau
VVETLRNAVRADRVGHAILFVGPRGTGKTSLARILAKAVNCTDLRDGDACDVCPSCVSIREGTTLDLIEIDAASNRGIDDVRNLRERLPYPPGQLRKKVYILDEAHQITRDAWNALLKSLEEPPPFVVFMFASTEPSLFPPAILSRLQRFDVRRLTIPEIEGKLSRILAADGRQAEPGAIHLIARLAAGGMRDAESMLDQLLSAAPDRIDESHVRDLLGLADADAVESFVDVLVRGDVAAGVGLLDQLDERGRDIRALLDQVVDAIRDEIVAGVRDESGARHDPVALIAAARRLAAIDPNRVGIGGLRFQLELALYGSDATALPARGPAPVVTAARSSSAVPASAPIVPPAAEPDGPARVPEPRAAKLDAPPVADLPAGEPVATARKSTSVAAERVAPPTGQGQPATAVRPEPSEPADEPAAIPSQPAVAAGTDVGADSALDRLLTAWPAIVTQLSAHPPTKPLVIACRPVAVDGAVVTLGFPEEQAFLKDAAERRRTSIEAGIAAVLGHPVTVHCVVANIELAPTGSSDAAFVLAEARRIFADDIVEVGEVS